MLAGLASPKILFVQASSSTRQELFMFLLLSSLAFSSASVGGKALDQMTVSVVLCVLVWGILYLTDIDPRKYLHFSPLSSLEYEAYLLVISPLFSLPFVYQAILQNPNVLSAFSYSEFIQLSTSKTLMC